MSLLEPPASLAAAIPGAQELAIIFMIGLLLFGSAYTIYNLVDGFRSGG